MSSTSVVFMERISIRYSTIETKEAPVLDITGIFFSMSTQVKIEMRNTSLHIRTKAQKRNLLYPIRALLFINPVTMKVLLDCFDNYFTYFVPVLL